MFIFYIGYNLKHILFILIRPLETMPIDALSYPSDLISPVTFKFPVIVTSPA